MRLFLKNQRSGDSAPIPIDIVGRDVPLTATLRGIVERRLAFALGRMGASILRIHVQLSDGRAPKEADKACAIRIVVPWKDAFTVAASDERLELAITKAAHAAARRLDDLSKRRKSASRSNAN